jgi:hypothetical protein
MDKSPKDKNKAGRKHTPLGALYLQPVPSGRSGALYTAFPYPTKISPETVALFIAAHTRPGDTVFDGFAGSGTTGLAALLCEKPQKELRDKAKRLGLSVTWGARNAILYEVGTLGAFVARTLTAPPSPTAFRKAAEEMLAVAAEADGWLYAAKDPAGNQGTIRYVVWTDHLRCPSCRHQVTFWDACVSLRPARIASQFICSSCGHEAPLDNAERVTETAYDKVLAGGPDAAVAHCSSGLWINWKEDVVAGCNTPRSAAA